MCCVERVRLPHRRPGRGSPHVARRGANFSRPIPPSTPWAVENYFSSFFFSSAFPVVGKTLRHLHLDFRSPSRVRCSMSRIKTDRVNATGTRARRAQFLAAPVCASGLARGHCRARRVHRLHRSVNDRTRLCPRGHDTRVFRTGLHFRTIRVSRMSVWMYRIFPFLSSRVFNRQTVKGPSLRWRA